MDSFSLIDGAALTIILLSGILAYARGFTRELFSIAGWIVSVIIAFIFAPTAVPLVKEVPYLNKIVSGCEATTIISFAFVLALSVVICSFFTPLLSNLIKRSFLNSIDQSLGFLFGAARGAVLVAVAIVAYSQLAINQQFPVVNESFVYKSFYGVSSDFSSVLPDDIPYWVVKNYDGLVSTCNTPSIKL